MMNKEKKPDLEIDFSAFRAVKSKDMKNMAFDQIRDEIKKLSEKYRYLKIYGE